MLCVNKACSHVATVDMLANAAPQSIIQTIVGKNEEMS